MRYLYNIILAVALIIFLLFNVMPSLAKAQEYSLKAPPVTQNSAIEIPVPESFEDPNDLAAWSVFIQYLHSSQAINQTIILDVQGQGGIVTELNKVVQAIKYAQAHGTKIIMKVVGPSYSAHSLLVCYGDSVSIEPEGSLMFHNIKAWLSLGPIAIPVNTGLLDASMTSLQNTMFQQCVAKDVLTTDQVKQILDLKEVTILPDNKVNVSPNRYGAMFVLEEILIAIITYGLPLLSLFIIVRVARKAWKI